MTTSAEVLELRLADGRLLSGVVYGPRDGTPLFFFHGLPGTRGESALFAEPSSTRLGLRFIAFERPGYKHSDAKPGRTILDWADDVADAATQLGYERFAVAGFSGGCPYALACAWKLPERVTRCLVIEGLGPIVGPGSALESMGRLHPQRLMLKYGARATVVLQFFVWLISTMGRRLPRLMVRQMGRPDRKMAAERPEIITWIRNGLFVDPFTHGAGTVTHELQLAMRDWGFALADIRVPVKIFVGDQDKNATPDMARGMAAQIPGAALEILVDAGHFVLCDPARCEQILADATTTTSTVPRPPATTATAATTA